MPRPFGTVTPIYRAVARRAVIAVNANLPQRLARLQAGEMAIEALDEVPPAHLPVGDNVNTCALLIADRQANRVVKRLACVGLAVVSLLDCLERRPKPARQGVAADDGRGQQGRHGTPTGGRLRRRGPGVDGGRSVGPWIVSSHCLGIASIIAAMAVTLTGVSAETMRGAAAGRRQGYRSGPEAARVSLQVTGKPPFPEQTGRIVQAVVVGRRAPGGNTAAREGMCLTG